MLRIVSIVGALALLASTALGQTNDQPITIGVLNDMSGNFADQSGPGSVVAARLAVEEFGGRVLGREIKIIGGDHQNKPDVASALARRWYDTQGVDLIVDTPNSGTALAVQQVANERGKINIVTTAGSVQLTGKSCSATGFHWVWDTYSNSAGLVKALAKAKIESWYFITADYAFGHALETDFRKAIEATGGKVVGGARHPVGNMDFSSLLLSAQTSGAKAIVVANGGNDIVNTLKTANEFGLPASGIRFVAPATFLTDVKSMGLDVANGLTFVDGFYWDLDDASRRFGKAFFDRHSAMPTMGQAGAYSAVRHYLAAVKAAGTTDPQQVARKMREMPVQDDVIRNGKLRADGRLVHDMYLAEVKKPAESKGPWDLEHIHETLNGDDVFRPLSESDCPLLKR
ncbi:ABC transporter substrate-binding protein [uncultured Enterovirga sp.]|uniref:ABC transporter substrate-binding protein n=1 Tax=uncultured Enterovirga sp. TaxID=2026352 RepID=UPI0035CB204D